MIECCAILHIEEDEENDLVDLSGFNGSGSNDSIFVRLVGSLLTNRPFIIDAFKSTMTQVWSLKGDVPFSRWSSASPSNQFASQISLSWSMLSELTVLSISAASLWALMAWPPHLSQRWSSSGLKIPYRAVKPEEGTDENLFY